MCTVLRETLRQVDENLITLRVPDLSGKAPFVVPALQCPQAMRSFAPGSQRGIQESAGS